MFENKQDTTLFLGSLDSASNYLISKKNSNGSNSLDDEEEAIKIVLSTINSLTCNLYDVKTISELFEKQLVLNRRCHSIAFIALLRFLGIKSTEADAHYQSVLHNLPEVELHFYLKLSFSCHWSEYFIECAHQLEAKVLSAVLKLLLEVKCEGELKYYIWHLTLQSIIWKIFTIQFPYMTDSDKLPPFQFKFSAPELLIDRNEENSTKENMLGDLSQVYDVVLKLLSQQAEQEINNDYLKVVFHAFKSLFQLVIKMRELDDPIMEIFKDLYPIFAQCLTEESAVSTIIKDFSECNKCAIDLFHLMMSWEISDLYLLFVLQNLWRDFNAYFKKNSFNACFINDYKKFHSFMIEKNLSWNSLKEIIEEQYVNKSDDAMKKYCCLLKNVVNNHGPCASRALEYFLLNFDLWEEYKIIDLLEKNLSSLDPFLIYEPLTSAIIHSSSEQKHRLLRCFYSMLTQAPQEIYGLVLDHVINRWGYCDYFKLPDFDSELTQFTRKTVTLEEAEQFLPALFVQSPKETLKTLIAQVLMQGTDAMKILEVLSTFNIVCFYESSESVECPLIDVLSHYFEDELSAQQAKNLMLIIKSLAEIEIAHKKIFPFDLFFEKCILSNLSPCDSSKVEFSLECLYVYFDVLMPDNGDEISVNSFAELIKHLGFILIFCIENGFIKLKERILSIFDQFASSKSKFRLAAALIEPPYNENDVAKLYVLGSFIKKIKDSTYLTHKDQMIGEKCELLWIWCCITNDEKLFSEKIKTFDLSYENLLTILTSLMPHLTKFEWAYSTKLISQYMTLLNIKASDYPWLLPGADLELYGIIRCLMDCFTLIIQGKPSNDYINVSSNFVNTIMNLLNTTNVPTALLLNVFLDVCQLVSLLNTEMVYVFSSLLLNLKKNITLTYDPEMEGDYMTLLELGIESLQKFKEIKSLLS